MAMTRGQKWSFAVATACFILLVSQLIIAVFRVTTYSRHRRAAGDLVESLPDRRPEDVDPTRWEHATDWAITAYHNVCFSEEHVPLAELQRFEHDVRRRLLEPVDLSTIDWLWDRLSQASAHGESYVTRFRPAYRHTVYGEPLE